jgi:hypothetical protein
MGNLITNMPLTDWRGARAFYSEVYWQFGELAPQLIADPTLYRRIRMISAQYVHYRESVQAITDFAVLEKWLNEEQHLLYNVPMNFFLERRQAVSFNTAKFQNVSADTFDTTVVHDDELSEEVVGPGWSAELVIEVATFPKLDPIALKNALASFGIYVISTQYSGFRENHDSNFLLSVIMLERDFKMEVNELDWILDQDEDDPFGLIEDDALDIEDDDDDDY